jgi:hypothetical protein
MQLNLMTLCMGCLIIQLKWVQRRALQYSDEPGDNITKIAERLSLKIRFTGTKAKDKLIKLLIMHRASVSMPMKCRVDLVP